MSFLPLIRMSWFLCGAQGCQELYNHCLAKKSYLIFATITGVYVAIRPPMAKEAIVAISLTLLMELELDLELEQPAFFLLCFDCT